MRPKDLNLWDVNRGCGEVDDTRSQMIRVHLMILF
jgi:hypothetical protein